jgi:hypothetical protein
MTDKTYNCSQAKITAERGNTMKADIMEVGNNYTDNLRVIREQLRSDYWALHTKITEENFSHFGEQSEALEKLGQLAIAMKRVDEAYGAMNSVRCW